MSLYHEWTSDVDAFTFDAVNLFASVQTNQEAMTDVCTQTYQSSFKIVTTLIHRATNTKQSSKQPWIQQEGSRLQGSDQIRRLEFHVWDRAKREVKLMTLKSACHRVGKRVAHVIYGNTVLFLQSSSVTRSQTSRTSWRNGICPPLPANTRPSTLVYPP